MNCRLGATALVSRGRLTRLVMFNVCEKRMKKEETDPLGGPYGIVLKFLGAAFLGCFVSLLLLLVVCQCGLEAFWNGWWPHLFWLIPVAWGLLGIFWFDRMLELAESSFNDFFDIQK